MSTGLPTVGIRYRRFDEAEPRQFRAVAFPCTIGRSAENNLVLDDPSISARHALLDARPEGIFLVDLGSTNGVVVDGAGHAEIQLREGSLRAHLGAIELELRLDKGDLERTQPFSILRAEHEPVASRSGPGTGVASATTTFREDAIAAGVMSLATLAASYLVSFVVSGRYTLRLALVPGLVVLGVALGIAAVLSLFLKLVAKRFRFLRLLAIVLVLPVFLFSMRPLDALLDGNVETPWLATGVSWIMAAAFLGFWIHRLVRLFGPRLARRRSALVTAAIAGVLLGTMSLQEYLGGHKFRGDVGVTVRTFAPETHGLDRALSDLERAAKAATDEIERHPMN
ncbi:MAG: FHA domain-containing protein [Deltaproteobacteria bacterium]|nr:FHA domain-containing protein [Deltaproteobacteria bacterium]